MKKLLAIFGAIVASGAAGSQIASVVKHQPSEEDAQQGTKTTKDKTLVINLGKVYTPVNKDITEAERNERILSQVKSALGESETFKNTNISLEDLALVELADSQASFEGSKESLNTIFNYHFIVNFALSDIDINDDDTHSQETWLMQVNLGIVWMSNDMSDEDNVREALENNRLFNMNGLTIARRTSFDKNGEAHYIAKNENGLLWEVKVTFKLQAHKNDINPSAPVNYEFVSIDLGNIERNSDGKKADVENTLINNNKFKSLNTEDLTLNFIGEDRAVFSATSFNMGIHHYEITVNFKLTDLPVDNGDHDQFDTVVMDLGTIFRTTTPDNELIRKIVESSQEFKEQNVQIRHELNFTATHASFMASNRDGHFVKFNVSFELRFNDKNNDNPSINTKEVKLSLDLGTIRRDGTTSDKDWFFSRIRHIIKFIIHTYPVNLIMSTREKPI